MNEDFNKAKALAVFLGALVVIAAVVVGALTVKQGTAKAKPLTAQQKMQRLIDSKKTSAVASARVVRCANGGAQTVSGRVIDPLYACPVLVTMKDGSGGCVGVLATDAANDKLVVVEAPATIDARYCK